MSSNTTSSDTGKSQQIEAAVIVMSIVLAVIVGIMAAIKFIQSSSVVEHVGNSGPPEPGASTSTDEEVDDHIVSFQFHSKVLIYS